MCADTPHTQTTLAHKRNVRGVAWSPFDPAIIATAAADNAIHLWDVRDSRNAKGLASFKARDSI
jgi:WD40 repeat protein